MTFFFTEIYIEKGQKRSKTGHKYHLFMSFARFRLCLEDFVAEGDEIKGHRPVHHDVGPSVYFRRYFVAEGDEITGHRPVHYERRPKTGLCIFHRRR